MQSRAAAKDERVCERGYEATARDVVAEVVIGLNLMVDVNSVQLQRKARD